MAPRNLPGDAETRLLSLIKDSTGQDGNPEGCTIPSEIPWFDASLAERGRRFVESNFFVILMLNFVNTFMGLANKPIAVLSFEVFTKGGRGCVGPRYVSTVKSMMSWFLSEKYGTDSDIFREVERVRKLHRLYARPATLPEVPHPGLELGEEYEEFARVVRKDLEKMDTSLCPTSLKGWSPPLLFTQFELAFVVYASVSSLFLYPEKLGLSGDSDADGISGYIHLWAVAGRMLGSKDEFNVALNPDKEFYLKIMQHLGFGTLKLMDATVAYMFEESIAILGIPFGASAKAIVYTILESGGVTPNNLWGFMNFGDKASYYATKVIFWAYKNLWGVRLLLNAVAREGFFFAARKSKKVASYR